jgi:glycosyltransferase involved in cell wall biosynthesis
MKNRDLLISVILPVQPDEGLSPVAISDLQKILSQDYETFEILVICDGTIPAKSPLRTLILKQEGCRLIQLSRSYGLEVAISAGLEAAIGDYCVVAVPGEDPLALIPELIRAARQSGKVILGQKKSKNREGLFYSLGRKGFGFIANRLLHLDIPLHTTFFSCFSRQAVYQIVKTKDKYRFLRAISAHIGLEYDLFNYDPISGSSKRRGFWQAVGMSLHIIALNSSAPLRFASLMAWILAIGNSTYLIYIFCIYFFKPGVLPGWTTLSFQQSVNFSMMFFIAAVGLEYLKVITEESKSRPVYYVSSEITSPNSIYGSQTTNTVETSRIE